METVGKLKFDFHILSHMASLTYKEFTKLETEIEAILNSRFLTALSTNSNEFAALTPTDYDYDFNSCSGY